MKSKENWSKNIVVFMVVALVYALLNSLRSVGSSSFVDNFGITFGQGLFLLLIIYFLLSLTKLGRSSRILITGFLEPIVANVSLILYYGFSWSIYPIAFFDSMIVLLLLAGGFFLADMIWRKK